MERKAEVEEINILRANNKAKYIASSHLLQREPKLFKN